jgi:thiamine kinase-like enzyme
MVETTALLQDTSAPGGIGQQDNGMACLSVQPMPEVLGWPIRDRVALCEYLKAEVFPRLAPPPYGEIGIERICYRKPVYLFLDTAQNIVVIGKFFTYGAVSSEGAWLSAEREYYNLKLLRGKFGMDSDSYQVANPLGKNKELYALLVTEKAPGKTLDYYVAKAIYEQQSQRLFNKLSYLARFLVKLHRNSGTDRQVSCELPRRYLSEVLGSLSRDILSSSERGAIEGYAARWWKEAGIFTEDREVIVHGDATPTNFLFQDKKVTGIDLERMKWADRCWDLGFVAAELKHHFAWRMGDGWAAEPFIGHFLWEYAVHYNGDTQFFYAITRKIALYMALGLLRIARNLWLDQPYRKYLIKEAKQCLKHGL